MSNLPAPGVYTVDAVHSSVAFVARHLVVTKVRGRFADWNAELVIGEDPTDSRVDVTIRAASIFVAIPPVAVALVVPPAIASIRPSSINSRPSASTKLSPTSTPPLGSSKK